MTSDIVRHPRGDTLAVTVPVTGIPDGQTISNARILIGTDADPLFDGAMTVAGATVSATVPAATTDDWERGSHLLEVKVKLTPSGQVSRVVNTRLLVTVSEIGSQVP